jgi:hypothetical protein
MRGPRGRPNLPGEKRRMAVKILIVGGTGMIGGHAALHL